MPNESQEWRSECCDAPVTGMEINADRSKPVGCTKCKKGCNPIMKTVQGESQTKKTKTIKVQCTFTIPVEVPDSEDYDETFDIEENHCPGTGIVGAAIQKHIKEFDAQGMCWACALKGKNKIV